MEKQQLAQVESMVHGIHADMQSLTVEEPLLGLIGIIHRPGWTSLAEGAFVVGILEAMQAHTKTLSMLKQALLSGAAKVALNPQPLPPGKHPEATDPHEHIPPPPHHIEPHPEE